MTTIMLVDDHEIVRQGLQYLIDTVDDLEVIDAVESASAAIDSARVIKPDLIILDLLMPDLSGIEVIPTLLDASPNSHIVVLSSTEDSQLTFDAVEAGATSFLLKTMTGEEILESLTRIAAGDDFLHPDVTRRIVKTVRTAKEMETPLGFESLSGRELRVLREMAEGANNAKIADRLFISEKTVKTHLTKIFAKLRVADRTEAVALAWRSGFMKSKSE